MSKEQRDPESSTALYKILSPEQVESLPSRDWTGTALDKRDGFLHLSTSDQLAGTLGRFFNKDTFPGETLFLLRLPRRMIRTDQKIQFDLAHGVKFGHIYSPIDPDHQFDERIKIKRNQMGEWDLPSLTF